MYVFVETEICMMIVYRQGNSPTVMDSISLPCLNIIQDILQSYKAPPSPRKLDKSPSPGLEMEVRPPVNIQVESLTGSTGNFRSVFQGYCGLYGNPLDVDREFLMGVPGTFAACLWHFFDDYREFVGVFRELFFRGVPRSLVVILLGIFWGEGGEL